MSHGPVNETLEHIRRFWSGHGRVMVSVTPPQLREGLQRADDATWLAAHRKHLPRVADLPGWNVQSVHPDFGTISQAMYWGCEPVDGPGIDAPFVNPAATTLEQALAVSPEPADAPHRDASRALRLYRELRRDWPGDDLWLRTPDAQGVLNTAGMVLEQTELFMGMVNEPAAVERFLEGICDWLIDLWRYLRQESGERICGNIWPGTVLPCDLGVSFTEDMMPLLAPEMYEQFSIPLLRKLDRAFGGLHIHCCGQWGRHAPTLAAADLNLLAVEFHHPYTTIEQLAPLPAQTVVVPYLAADQPTDFADAGQFYHHLLDSTDRRFWFAFPSDDPVTLELARSLIARS